MSHLLSVPKLSIGEKIINHKNTRVAVRLCADLGHPNRQTHQQYPVVPIRHPHWRRLPAVRRPIQQGSPHRARTLTGVFQTHHPCVQDGKFIAAGGSGSNEAKIFDRTANNAVCKHTCQRQPLHSPTPCPQSNLVCLSVLQLVGMIAGLTRGVFTLDWCPISDTIAVAGGDASIRVFDVVRS